MGLDYYAIINVTRDASLHEIKLAYRQLALRLHPHRKRYSQHPNPAPSGTFLSPLPSLAEDACWKLCNEAYDVLSDPLRREIFDKYGEEGLKKGVSAPNGFIQPYCYHKEPMRTYFEFFGSFSPYADLIDAVVKPPLLYSVQEGVGVKNKDPTVHQLLHLDLKEVFHGGVKVVKLMRHEFVDEFQTETKAREVEIAVPFYAGILEGTRLLLPECSDQGPTKIPADIAFYTIDKPHKVFRREQWNLHMQVEVSLQQALVGFKFTVETIDDRKLHLNVTDVINCDYVKRVPDEGLPIPHEIQMKGDLFIHFKINFPSIIPKHLRVELCDIFDSIAASEQECQKPSVDFGQSENL